MLEMELEKNLTIEEIEELFDEDYKNKKNNYEHLFKAFYLNFFDFVSRKFEFVLENKKEFEKDENELIIIYLKSNNKLKRYDENIKFWEEYKSNIKFEYKKRGTILDHIAFSFSNLGKMDNALELYKLIKNLQYYYHENYIDCLMEIGNLEEALLEIEKYKPNNIPGKVWKAINYAEIYYRMNNLEELEKKYKKATEVYNKFSGSKQIDIHSGYLHMLGLFALKLEKKPQAILHFKNSILSSSEGVVDNIYKDKSIGQLKIMGVKNT